MSDDKLPVIDYGAILADLEAKKAALESLIASVRIAAASGLFAVGDIPSNGFHLPQGGSGSPIKSDDIPAGAFHGKSIPEATKAYLSMVKKKQTTKEIADALHRGGMESTSDKFETIVYTALRRMKDAGEMHRSDHVWTLGELLA